MALMMVLFWGAIAAAFIAYVRRDRHAPHQPSASHPDDPQRMLEQRFARGEIDEEEFRRRRDVLRDTT